MEQQRRRRLFMLEGIGSSIMCPVSASPWYVRVCLNQKGRTARQRDTLQRAFCKYVNTGEGCSGIGLWYDSKGLKTFIASQN